jgi:hypothetical protein
MQKVSVASSNENDASQRQAPSAKIKASKGNVK